ncbi:MAG: ribonuclease R [Pseudomonadota bacterium]
MKRKQKTKITADPYAAREASKYERPIVSREYILQYLAERDAPLTLKQLAEELEITDEQELEALRRRLNAMERDGQIMRNRRDGYGLMTKMDLIAGRVIGHPDGYGFLTPDAGGDDLFLSAKQMRNVLHGDRAVARVSGIDRRGRREGVIVEVLEHNTTQLVGRFYLERGIGFVVASNKRISQDIVVPAQHQAGAAHGQIVVVELIAQPSFHSQPIGKVIEILGDHMAPGMEIDVAIRSYNLPQQWPSAVHAETAHLDPDVPDSIKQGREDLRDLPLVTIDGADARDFDDAVFCEPHGKGWRLLVAIADVSTYVRAGTALDSAAFERGNSVYFPERVIPMLPEILSNGLCSLNPHVDRLCLVCEMIVGPNGKLEKYRFFEGVMRSHARLTYDKVAAILIDNDAALCREYAELLPHLRNLHELYKVLRDARAARGAIDFETTETRIVFGPDRKIEKIIPVVRNDAHRLIEECMVLANVAAARFLLQHEVPALYRVHEGPTEEKLTDLRSFLAELGLSLGGGNKPTAKHYAKLLDSVRGRPDAHLLQTVLLRSLSQAVYSPENIGHFGLAHEAYTHFTSPIRRYPDLLVHRAIRCVIAGKSTNGFPYDHAQMQAFGEHCSMTERRADEATRDAISWLKCEYMMDKVGEEFDGIISAVTGFGIFVELNEIYVEGLVHVTALSNDYYHFDPVRHRLSGERTGMTYRLGDKVRVQVARVDLDERKIDFELAAAAQVKKKRRAR